MAAHPDSVTSRILARVHRKGRGWVFTPRHFLDLGSRTAVGLALMRLARADEIRHLARGLYDYPARHPRLGLLSPTSDAVAHAIAGRDAVRLQPSGAQAANLLGISTQVPLRVVYLTDGPSGTVRIGKQTIVLKKTTPRQMATAGKVSGTVIQALRWLGRKHVDDTVVGTLGRRLSDADRRQLLKDARYAPAWIGEILRRLGESEKV